VAFPQQKRELQRIVSRKITLRALPQAELGAWGLPQNIARFEIKKEGLHKDREGGKEPHR